MHVAVVFTYMCRKEWSSGLSSGRPGKVTTDLPGRPAPKTGQIRARKHLQMLKLPVIMQLQDQPLPQPPNTIHNGACAPFRFITFGDALLVCSSSMHALIHLITFKPVYQAHQPLKPRHARDSALRAG